MSAAKPILAQQNWEALGKALTEVRAAARAERKLHGEVLPQTKRRLDEALACAEAAVAVHDAKTAGRTA